MSDQFEFRSQSLKQKLSLFGVRGLLIGMISLSLYMLATDTSQDLSEILRRSGGVFVSIWAYTNIVQAKVEIQELFIPPFQMNEGVELLVIGGSLFTIPWLLLILSWF